MCFLEVLSWFTAGHKVQYIMAVRLMVGVCGRHVDYGRRLEDLMTGWDQPSLIDETSFVFAEGTPSSMEIAETVAPAHI